MWLVHRIRRRFALGPVVVALVSVGALCLLNLLGAHSLGGSSTPDAVTGLPPQLPAVDSASHSATAPLPGQATSGPAPSPQHGTPAPGTAAPAHPGVGPATPPPGPGGGAAPGSPAPGGPVLPPAPAGGTQPAPTVTVTAPGPTVTVGGSDPYDQRLRVSGLLLSSDHSAGARVRCDGRDEVLLAATVMVDGGSGDVVFQWVFDAVRVWPSDVLHFTGEGRRQQTVQISWPVPPLSLGHVRGTVELRVLQPVLSAQTQRLSVDVVCG